MSPSAPYGLHWFRRDLRVAGNPALSVCSGFNEAGLPFSLQIVGRLFDEATVLRAGDAYERTTPWGQRRPALRSPSTSSTNSSEVDCL